MITERRGFREEIQAMCRMSLEKGTWPQNKFILVSIALIWTAWSIGPTLALRHLKSADENDDSRSPQSPPVDTSGWIGASYTPSSASNSLWWWNYEQHEAEVVNELRWARTQLGFSALRMFLHSMVYEGDNGKTLLSNMAK